MSDYTERRIPTYLDPPKSLRNPERTRDFAGSSEVSLKDGFHRCLSDLSYSDPADGGIPKRDLPVRHCHPTAILMLARRPLNHGFVVADLRTGEPLLAS
jgi:hypothetical protein